MTDAVWLVEETGFDVARANYHETLFTVGNVTTLETRNLAGIGGAVGCQESNRICSIQHTCVSCASNTVTICA